MKKLWRQVRVLIRRLRDQEEPPTERDYELWLALAKKKGWAVPHRESVFVPMAWISYWEKCYAYELDDEHGRPVVPHRSGGHL